MAHQDDVHLEDDTAAHAGGFNSMGVLTVVLPFAATIASLLFGIVIGGIAGWVIKPSQQPIEYMKTASLSELQLVCEPVVEEQKTQLAKVKEEIGDLKSQVAVKEAEVAELRAELEIRDKRGGKPSSTGAGASRVAQLDSGAINAELTRSKELLAEAKLQVQMLTQVKDQLVDQLTRTQQRLEKTESDLQAQVAITEVLRDENVTLKDDVIVQRWFRMITEAQLDICEKGGKKKTEACRQAVVDEVSKVKHEFVHCIRSNQAAPGVLEIEKGKALPHFARMLDQNDKNLAGFYLQMCDPTLPEVEIPTPGSSTETESAGIF